MGCVNSKNADGSSLYTKDPFYQPSPIPVQAPPFELPAEQAEPKVEKIPLRNAIKMYLKENEGLKLWEPPYIDEFTLQPVKENLNALIDIMDPGKVINIYAYPYLFLIYYFFSVLKPKVLDYYNKKLIKPILWEVQEYMIRKKGIKAKEKYDPKSRTKETRIESHGNHVEKKDPFHPTEGSIKRFMTPCKESSHDFFIYFFYNPTTELFFNL